jgi:hypothetical protein
VLLGPENSTCGKGGGTDPAIADEQINWMAKAAHTQIDAPSCLLTRIVHFLLPICSPIWYSAWKNVHYRAF